MIFVPLGTQKFPHDRLLRMMDGYAENGLIKDDIFAQIGNARYTPRHFEYIRFLDRSAFEEQICRADLVVTHGGVGIIISALAMDKPVVAMPRLQKYGEHVDDHQLEIAMVFEENGYLFCCRDGDDLLSLIQKSRTHKFAKYVSRSGRIQEIVTSYLENLEEQRR